MLLFTIRKTEIEEIIRKIMYDENGFIGLKIENHIISFTYLVKDFSLTTFISQHISCVDEYTCSFRNGSVLMTFLETIECPVINFTLSKKKSSIKISGTGETPGTIVYKIHQNKFKDLDLKSPEIKFEQIENVKLFIKKLETLFMLGDDVVFGDSIIKSDDSKNDCVVTYYIPWSFETYGSFKISPIIDILSRILDDSEKRTVPKVLIGINGLFSLKILHSPIDDDESPIIIYYQAPLTPA